MIFRQLEKLYHQPLFDLISQSRAVHLQHWRGEEVQRCSLLSIETSPEFYPEIVSTHTFQNRLNTIAAVQESGMSVCCGGIIGMGESEGDRLRMLEVSSNFDPPPESVPINCLMAMPGTPLANQPPVDIL